MNERDEKLDLIRGVSALLVLMGHARNFLMVDSNQVVNPNALTKAFYLLTSLHHPAVMVFFVLSGYFVGGSVLGAVGKNRFSWPNYGLARMSRLWVVLLPALLLTLLADLVGRHFSPQSYNGGNYALFNSGPTLIEPARHGAIAFLGNMAFLQNIFTPIYGTNGPLWSLAFEFWYYVVFPLLILSLWGKSVSKILRISQLILLAILLWLLPKNLLLSGTIWLMGVGVWIIARNPAIRRLSSGWTWKIAGAFLFAASIILAKSGKVADSDYIVGLSFSLWMPSLLGSWKRTAWWTKMSTKLSDISFSLYIIHFPVMFLIVSVWAKGIVFQPKEQGIIYFIALNLVCFAIACLFWWCFESRTEKVRRWLKFKTAKV